MGLRLSGCIIGWNSARLYFSSETHRVRVCVSICFCIGCLGKGGFFAQLILVPPVGGNG